MTVREIFNYIYNLKDLLQIIAYICSISFQLTAGILLVNNTKVSKKGIINAFCAENSKGIAFEENGTLADDWGLKEIIRTSWINKCAFFYLVIGYLLSVCAEEPSNWLMSLILILVIVCVLYFFTSEYSKYKSTKFGKLRMEDMPLENGVLYYVLESDKNKDYKQNVNYKDEMCRKKQNNFYNFNYEQEFLIYRNACKKKLTRREKKIVGKKTFNTYDEWSGYIESKYKNITIKSLKLRLLPLIWAWVWTTVPCSSFAIGWM